MKVFISSVISGFEHFREASVTAAKALGHTVIRAEDFTASPSSPQQVCLAGVRDADVVVLLIGARYGYKQASELSATHEEYREARERKPVLVLIQSGVDREPEQEEFLREVQSWNKGHFTASFMQPEDLRDSVTRALHQHELSTAAGAVDEREMQARADQLLPSDRGGYQSGLCLVVVAGPRQQVLRPSELEDRTFQSTLQQQALFGPVALFDSTQGTKPRLREHALILEQEDSSILVDELGSVRTILPTFDRQRRGDFSGFVLIEEDIREKVDCSLRFTGWLLDNIDDRHRLSSVLITLSLIGSSIFGWQTRAEQQASRGSVSIRMPTGQRGDRIVVQPSPALRNRAALLHDTTRITEDLVVLLRRQLRA